jgi:hypothetical protein
MIASICPGALLARLASKSDEDRARRVAHNVGQENRDPVTRREAIEQQLSDKGLPDVGERVGQHNP